MEARVSWFFLLPCSRMDSSSLTYCLVESNSRGLMRPMIHLSSFVLPTTCSQTTQGVSLPRALALCKQVRDLSCSGFFTTTRTVESVFSNNHVSLAHQCTFLQRSIHCSLLPLDRIPKPQAIMQTSGLSGKADACQAVPGAVRLSVSL